EYPDPDSSPARRVFLSDTSFALMTLEAALPAPLRRAFADLHPAGLEDDDNPLPPVPVRAFELEELWVEEDRGRQGDIVALAEQRGLMGPGTPLQIQSGRSVTSLSVTLTSFVVALMIGFILNITTLIPLSHSRVSFGNKIGLVL
ncbi:hypothetical protein KIPB_015399, partial [Kipferlia bialata]